MHLPVLIVDIAFILVIAGIVSVVFRSINQPVVLGYLVAGMLVGPNVTFIPTVQDMNSVKIWAELGIIFLLFCLGLEFSFKKLAQVGRVATITALFEIIFMLLIGYWVGRLIGWNRMDSLYLGGILSISSTTIIVKAFDELKIKTKKFVSIVFGVLIVEDIVAIILLVILSTTAATQVLSGLSLLGSITRLMFFLVLWFTIGIYIVPNILNTIRKYLNNETTLVISIALCLLMVLIAVYAGFSAALGAFVMGSIIAETKDSKNIIHLLEPVKDLFGAVFFVSVGMMIDPLMIYNHLGVVLLITIITIFGKTLSSTLGALIAGENLEDSVRTGLSLAQIGEFSFIIATLGVTLKVTSDFLYPIAVAVSVITTFTTPFCIKYADFLSEKLESILPNNTLNKLEQYRLIINQSSDKSFFKILLRSFGAHILINIVVVISISIMGKLLLLDFLSLLKVDPKLAIYLAIIITLILCSPFLWAIIFVVPQSSALKLSQLKTYSKAQLLSFFMRATIVLILINISISQFSSIAASSAVLIVIGSIIAISLTAKNEILYRYVENKFLSNLTVDDEERIQHKSASPFNIIAPWDASMVQITVSSSNDSAGKSLKDLAIKNTYGALIVLVERGSQKILAPNQDFILYPYDKIYLVGTDDQLQLVKEKFESEPKQNSQFDTTLFGLGSIYVSPESDLKGKRIRDCNFKDSINGLVVGIERNGQRILNPAYNTFIQEEDLLWLVGDKSKISKISKIDATKNIQES
jgi:CPA2 family monovalent cation:H+ antiporter-2